MEAFQHCSYDRYQELNLEEFTDMLRETGANMWILVYSFRFPNCSMLEVRNKKCGSQILILRELSSLEPAPNV